MLFCSVTIVLVKLLEVNQKVGEKANNAILRIKSIAIVSPNLERRRLKVFKILRTKTVFCVCKYTGQMNSPQSDLLCVLR